MSVKMYKDLDPQDRDAAGTIIASVPRERVFVAALP